MQCLYIVFDNISMLTYVFYVLLIEDSLFVRKGWWEIILVAVEVVDKQQVVLHESFLEKNIFFFWEQPPVHLPFNLWSAHPQLRWYGRRSILISLNDKLLTPLTTHRSIISAATVAIDFSPLSLPFSLLFAAQTTRKRFQALNS